MTTVAAPRCDDAPPERSAEWRERSGRLYEELRRPARAMIRRAFRGAFGDDEIEDIYANAWVGTLRALERRHDQLTDEEIPRYELTANPGWVGRGEGCADRAPVLKAYAAGLADADQQRQARQHLSHCRHCADFVAKLSGHLHDIGASLAVPSALEGIVDGRYSLPERMAHVIHGVHESAGKAFTGGGEEGVRDGAPQAATVPGGPRG